MAETVIAKLADGRKLVLATATGPSSYSTGGFDVNITSLKEVEQVLAITNNGGYKAEPGDASISGNTVTVLVRHYTYADSSSGPADEVDSGTNLSGVTFTLLVIGF